MTRVEFVRQRDGDIGMYFYCALMRKAYRGALKSIKKMKGWRTHPYRRKWVEGYLEFREQGK